MTVQGLIKELLKLPENTTVLVQGYEGGFSDIGFIKQTKVSFNQNKEEWNGPHEEDTNGDHQAILLLRANNPMAEK